MHIKRNIFETKAKMTDEHQAGTVPMPNSYDSIRPLPGCYRDRDADVRHAPVPRIGEQK